MIKLSLEYWNQLSSTIIFISALLGGFSLSVIVSLFDNDVSGSVMKSIFIAAVIATSCFLISIFAMTQILLISTPGYPLKIEEGDILIPRIIGALSFFIGICSILTLKALSGWTKSRRLGIFTTTISIVAFVLILLVMR